MLTTTRHDVFPTLNPMGDLPRERDASELVERYEGIVREKRLHWTIHHELLKLLGAGGQGLVFLTERRGADGFTLPIALKIFSPERYLDARSYDDAMARIARVSARVATIQHDNLLDVHNFVDRNRIRMMVMEWIDGYDLSHLLRNEMFHRVRGRVSAKRWEYINRVIVTAGPAQPQIKPGVAVAIVRDCLAALAALHREGVVHGDVKPSNLMLKRTGSAKLIDIGSAFEMDDPPPTRSCTPTYAAPEILEGNESTPRSDLASLGYILVELMAGRQPFAGLTTLRELLEAKRALPHRLHEFLPGDVACNELLMNFCRGLIAADPLKRFPDAEAAEMVKEGAAAFHRQLVFGDMASEYPNEIRLWVEELKEIEASDGE